MSITGLCDICEDRTAEHSCPQCGTVVCERHYDEEFGACMRCAPTGSPSSDHEHRESDDFETFQL
jgi:hypothetical protein